MKKVIIFDMDGVLFDTIPLARKMFMKRHPGITLEEYMEIYSGNFHENIAKYAHLKIEETEEENKAYKENFSKLKSQIPLFDGMKNLLTDLKGKGYTLTVNTSAFERNCFPLLENAGVSDVFDCVLAAESSKDKVEKFKIIKEKYGVQNEDLIFITDALGDVKDAEKAKVPTIAVTWGVHDRSFFEREEFEVLRGVVDTVDELQEKIIDL